MKTDIWDHCQGCCGICIITCIAIAPTICLVLFKTSTKRQSLPPKTCSLLAQTPVVIIIRTVLFGKIILIMSPGHGGVRSGPAPIPALLLSGGQRHFKVHLWSSLLHVAGMLGFLHVEFFSVIKNLGSSTMSLHSSSSSG